MPITALMLDLGLFVLRVPYALALLYFHGREEALSAWRYLGSEIPQPWTTLKMLVDAGSSLPAVIPAGMVALGLIGAGLLLFGFATRFAAGLLLVVLLGAAWVFWKNAMWPSLEAALAYSLISTALIFLGGGNYSLDWFFRKKEKSPGSYFP